MLHSDGIKYASRGIEKPCAFWLDYIFCDAPNQGYDLVYMRSEGGYIICAIYGIIHAKNCMNEIPNPKLKTLICDIFEDNYVFLFQQNPTPCHVPVVY